MSFNRKKVGVIGWRNKNKHIFLTIGGGDFD
jgi:hypothetical protein